METLIDQLQADSVDPKIVRGNTELPAQHSSGQIPNYAPPIQHPSGQVRYYAPTSTEPPSGQLPNYPDPATSSSSSKKRVNFDMQSQELELELKQTRERNLCELRLFCQELVCKPKINKTGFHCKFFLSIIWGKNL